LCLYYLYFWIILFILKTNIYNFISSETLKLRFLGPNFFSTLNSGISITDLDSSWKFASNRLLIQASSSILRYRVWRDPDPGPAPARAKIQIILHSALCRSTDCGLGLGPSGIGCKGRATPIFTGFFPNILYFSRRIQ
jgi:hypothetical protein